jgi:hypothetical protein
MVDEAQVAAAGERLAGAPVRSIVRVAGSGNNQLYRLAAADAVYAFKWYPALAGDARDRLGAEFGALRFLADAGVNDVPRAFANDAELRCALYAWVEGVTMPTDVRAIDAMLAFMERLHGVRNAAGAAALPRAAEAVTRWAELAAQVEARFERLELRAPGEPALGAFLRGEARPLWARIARAGAERAPTRALTLSPSDFGTHNMLLASAPEGERAVFVDFEYFGWDDPVKLVCDVLWHPAMGLRGPLAGQLLGGAADIYRDDASFEKRLHARVPAFGLRWALIVLNEFLPTHWERRRLAGAPADWGAAKARQLDRARALVKRADAVLDGASWTA